MRWAFLPWQSHYDENASCAGCAKTGYARGHLVPRDDMNRSKAPQTNTFFLTNMAPQLNPFDGGLWLRLERLAIVLPHPVMQSVAGHPREPVEWASCRYVSGPLHRQHPGRRALDETRSVAHTGGGGAQTNRGVGGVVEDLPGWIASGPGPRAAGTDA
jgi:hypothetical protein